MSGDGRRGVSRRTVVAAVWAAPVIAVAVAAPSAAASPVVPPGDVGAYRLEGTCGISGSLGPGFFLTASSDSALPVGTVVTVIASRTANAGVISVSGGLASIDESSPTIRVITLTASLPANALLAIRTTLSTQSSWKLDGTVSLPAGYTAGPTAKATGAVTSTFGSCTPV